MFNKLPETKLNCLDCKNHNKTGFKCLHMIHMNRLKKDTITNVTVLKPLLNGETTTKTTYTEVNT